MNSSLPQAAILAQLREHITLGGLPEAALKSLIESGELLHYEPGDAMLEQGALSDSALFIISGEADILVETSFGDTHIARASPNMLIGEIGAFSHLPRIATARAGTAVDALRIGRPQLLELGRTNPQLLLFVIGQLGERLSRLNQAIGFYTHTLSALERNDFNAKLLDELLNPMPELIDFSHSFRRLAEQITLKRRRFEEMAHAAVIQRSMLPRSFESANTFRAIDLYGELHPANEVGGDFFDYFAIDDKRLAVSIGDVSGKGVPASLFMAITQSLIRLTLRGGGDLATELARVNDLLAANNEESMFATAFCAVISVDTGEIAYSNCGHNAPIILHRNGAIDKLTPTGPPLGASSEIRPRIANWHLTSDDLLVLFSDGLPEATNRNGEFFGDERIELTVREHAKSTAQGLVRAVIDRVTDFESGAPRFDDIACVSLYYNGPTVG